MQRVHCTACRQTFLTDTTDRCPLCRHIGGLIDPDSPQVAKDLLARKAAESPPSDGGAGLADAARMASATMGLVKWVLGGIFAIALGILLIAHPDLRGHRSLRLSDLWPGLGAIVAGLGMIGLALFVLKRSAAKPTSRPPEGEKKEGG